MIRNYLKSAYRNLLKNKVSSLVNITGLSIGLAVVILITLFVSHEKSYDQWIGDKENIYRVYRQWGNGSRGVVWTPQPLVDMLSSNFPEIEKSAAMASNGETLISFQGEKVYVEKVAQVDSSFFQLISFPLIHHHSGKLELGNKDLVLSLKLASHLFGEIDPLGQIVRFFDTPYQVVGVFDTEKFNSHLQYDVYTRFTWSSDSWTGNNRATYIKLKSGASASDLESKMTALANEKVKAELAKNNYFAKDEDLAKWKLQPVTDIHLQSAQFSWIGDSGGNIRNVNIYIIIALLVMLVAIINYINLSTAQATKRAKEVGVRKSIGANRSQLIFQFLAESVLQALCAVVLAIVLAEALLPIFNGITDRSLSLLNSSRVWSAIPILLVFSALLGMLAGAYPAFIISGFRSATVLKGELLQGADSIGLRRFLVSSQFAVSIGLLVVMAFIFIQVQFMINHELGFQADQILVIPLNDKDTHKKISKLKAEFTAIPGVQSISTASNTPGQRFSDWTMEIAGMEERVNPNVLFLDEDGLETFGLTLKEGRFLSIDVANDTINNFVVNETFVQQFQIEKPLGHHLKFLSGGDEYGQIVGVVKDFHFRGLENQIQPLVMTGLPQRNYGLIKISTADLNSTISRIDQIWQQKVEPLYPMRFSFLDDKFQQQYGEQQRFGKAMLCATVLTLLIAILGLFGLTTFSVERRIKEIGIRKVLGASVFSIVSLFSSELLKLVLIAFVVAVPLSWYLTNLWLADFAYRIQVQWWVFLGAGTIAVLVTLLTVSFQSIRAALRNPIESLRNE